jgi:hypothetical protein
LHHHVQLSVLQANAMREFELLGPNEDRPNPLLLERLRACCQVVNALGYKVLRHFKRPNVGVFI